MGLKSTIDGSSEGAAFSKDILRVEICGPEEEHLTIIDVPGIFENPQEGFSTAHDVALVKSMVKGYLKDSRTIILAVIPCNVDVATQNILTYAAEADPDGKRTLGVLTKPDLVKTATRQAAMDLIRCKRRDLQLGYYAVRNRGADDTSSSKDERDFEEKLFFEQDPWSKLDKSRLGIPALRKRLRELLMERTKSEFPKVRQDIQQQLAEAKAELKALGQPRSTADEQRAYLGNIVSRYSELKKFGLDAYYTGDPVFEKRPELKLVTRIREMNTAFSNTFFKNAHTRNFEKFEEVTNNEENDRQACASETSDDTVTRSSLYSLTFSVPPDDFYELDGILSEPYQCCSPDKNGIMKHLEHLFLTSRGYEMGTFGGHMLPTAFKEQSKKWEDLTLAHISNVILVVHRFIYNVVQEACADQQVRETLWSFILEDMVKAYQSAMDHAKFLIRVEREGRSITYNPAFNKAFDKVKAKRSSDRYKSFATTGIEETCHTIHDVLESYYDIARARFVDMVCTQVVDHFLLGGDKSPLGVLSPNRVFEMSSTQLEVVAGEDLVTKSTREMLVSNISMFEAAKKILCA
ncbi:Iinterferon-induced GTP-binding protein Mx2 [Colletotrichum plurivorum]|uniref:Iinterferon-induced GTP-binding protein Mx2 n=1 Tax=Colletotrichum plurivorum TaxID=2175906 RepID=A0A8H6NDE1_9PEZI|nr:Iinterferon-induced GTP-binding protein Mx2 [Colletotrichum plurivorum]